jgi:nicotinamidase-related amidase
MPQTEPDPKAMGTHLGIGAQTRWLATADTVDMTTDRVPPHRLQLATDGQSVVIDLRRTAILVIDMQNDFCTKGGWADHVGGDYAADRAPIAKLRKLLPALRTAHVPVIWVNWGNRPDLANMPPNQIHVFNPTGTGIGLGDKLPGSGAHVLEKNSWSAAVVDELEQHDDDIRVDKHRISGFWDTPLDSILRNLGIRSLLFAGVNTDQCVLHSLSDASFLGYGCILLTDCCATSSPEFCTQATLWNVQKCFGFVSDSARLLAALAVT